MSRHRQARWFHATATTTAMVALATLVAALLIAAPASLLAAGGADATEVGIIAGKVTDRRGAPQSGVPVNILSPGGRVVARATTQTTGRFSVPQLKPGIYSAEVVSPSFLPYLKTAIAVKAGGLALLDVSLYKLAESVELNFPGNVEQATEDWKWVLRAQHPTRPVLRFQQEEQSWASLSTNGNSMEREPHESALHGTLKLTAGDEVLGFGQGSGLQTSFDMDYRLGPNESLGLTGRAGLKEGTPATSFHTSWNRTDGDVATTHLTGTVRQIFLPREYWMSQTSRPGAGAGSDDRVQSATFGYSQERKISQRIAAEYGTLLDLLSLGRHQSRRLSPYGRVRYVAPSGGVISVAYTSVGPRVMPSGWDTQKQGAEQWLAIPQISAGSGGDPALETGRHAEAHWEQTWASPLLGGPIQTEAAVFIDELNAPALTVSFDAPSGGEQLSFNALDQDIPGGSLRDPYSNRHFVSGTNYRAAGARAAASFQLNKIVKLLTAYSYAGSLIASAGIPALQDAGQIRDALRMERNHSFAVKVDALMPGSDTRVITSYRWLPARAVTLADPYNRGIGQADPYLSVYILQPLPSPDILPGQFAAVADFSNLLAEGYLPFQSASGAAGTLYPAARVFRGGFNFTF